MKKLTIKDIAEIAGVSQTAVSFVLNDKPGVSDETRRRVNEIIEEYNFSPALSSRRLALNKTFNICLSYIETSSPFNDYFYFEVAKGISSYVSRTGYNLVVAPIRLFNGSYQLPSLIHSRDTDGVILLQDISPKLVQDIESMGIPCVVTDSYNYSPDILSVGFDATAFTIKAVNYLNKKGHTKIGLIGSSFISDYWNSVIKGYSSAMESLGCISSPGWICNTAYSEESAYLCMQSILKCPELPSAVFCTGDVFALGAINCIKNSGLSVPEDISVLGIDNIITGSYIEPGLTTIDLNKEVLGKLTVDLLIKKMNNEPVSSLHLSDFEIIERQSVKTL